MLNAKENCFQEISLFNIPALFSNGRLNDSALPEGIFCYDLRGSDYDPGHPITIEKKVVVNHAASVLTMSEVPIPESGRLWLGKELNFTGGMLTIPQYLQKTKDFVMKEKSEAIENAIGKANEELLINGNADRYALFQLMPRFCHGKQYVGLNYLKKNNLNVNAEQYNLVYSGKLMEKDNLDTIYEKFNINHPEDFLGHSLSVSDVIVILRDRTAEAYYIENVGYSKLSDFIPQRLHMVATIRKNS